MAKAVKPADMSHVFRDLLMDALEKAIDPHDEQHEAVRRARAENVAKAIEAMIDAKLANND